jgi:hypothetical protein
MYSISFWFHKLAARRRHLRHWPSFLLPNTSTGPLQRRSRHHVGCYARRVGSCATIGSAAGLPISGDENGDQCRSCLRLSARFGNQHIFPRIVKMSPRPRIIKPSPSAMFKYMKYVGASNLRTCKPEYRWTG